jgi:hypothetical protein
MSNTRNWLARMGRRLCPLTVIAIMMILLCAGCGVFGKSAKEQSLRKQVEADSFPSAKQVGLQAETPRK